MILINCGAAAAASRLTTTCNVGAFAGGTRAPSCGSVRERTVVVVAGISWPAETAHKWFDFPTRRRWPSTARSRGKTFDLNAGMDVITPRRRRRPPPIDRLLQANLERLRTWTRAPSHSLLVGPAVHGSVVLQKTSTAKMCVVESLHWGRKEWPIHKLWD